MKKYVDYKPLHVSKAKVIKKNRTKIKDWSKWAVLFIVTFVASFITSFYAGMLSLSIIICIYSLFMFIESIISIRMYEGFIKNWEKFEKEANDDWQVQEDIHNRDWNEHFNSYRLSGMSESDIIKSEKRIIESSIKSVQRLVEDRQENMRQG